MKYKKSIFIVIACVLLLVGTFAMAGSVKQTGTTGASELLIPVGVRSAAMSGADIAGATGIDAIYVNPAGASVVKNRTEAVLSYQNYLADIKITYLGALADMGGFGTVGINLKTVNFGDIQQTTWDRPEGTGTVFSPTYITFGATYGRRFTDRIYFGANLNVISEKIMSVSATGMGVDLGLQYVNDATGLKLGVALCNFGTGMKFDGADLERRGSISNTEAGSTPSSYSMISEEFQLPTQLKLGLSYDWVLTEKNLLTLSGAYYNNNTFSNQIILGAEYAFNKMAFLRGSYSIAYKEDDEGTSFVGLGQDYLYGPAFGAGVIVGAGGLNFQFDYSYRITEFFDDIQMFGFTFAF